MEKFPKAKCDGCPLKNRRFAKPSIHGLPRIMYVGEAPGRNELTEGEAFVGDAGKILRAGIENWGLDRYGFFLTNVVPCDFKSDEEYLLAANLCHERLVEEVQTLKPELVVALGGTAKDHIVPGERKGIMSLSGTFGSSEGFGTVLYLLHPAFILHTKEGERYFHLWLDHLNEARLFFEAEPIKIKTRVARSLAGLKRYLKDLSRFDAISLDVETTSFFPWDEGVGLTLSGERFNYGDLISVALSGDGLTSYVFPIELLRNGGGEFLREFLLGKKINCHNAQFDLPFIWVYIAEGVRASDDTMLKSYALEESPWHGLKRLGRKYLGVEDWSGDLHEYLPDRGASFANVPRHVLYPYTGTDVAITGRLNGLIELDADSKRLYENVLLPMCNLFVEMTYRGIKVNPKTLLKAWHELGQVLDSSSAFLRRYKVTNPNSWVQIYKVLYDQFELDIPEEVKTGKIFLESLLINEEFKNQVHSDDWEVSEFAKAVRDYRSAMKGRNTYLRNLAQSLDLNSLCVHPDYKLFATVTGRLVISNPMLTNYVKATGYAELIRSPLEPRPGYVWFHWDYKQMELRIYQALTGDQKMGELLIQKRDPHHEVGLEIYGPDFDEKNRKVFGLLRTITKTSVFGRLFGRGAPSVAVQLEIPVKEANRIMSIIDSFWDLSPYHEYVREALDGLQEVTNPLGRKRRFPLITDDNYHRCFNQGCNFGIQSTANDLNFLSALRLARELENVRVLFTCHDSGDAEVPQDRFEEYLPIILEILRNEPMKVLKTKIPFEVSYTHGDCWKPE